MAGRAVHINLLCLSNDSDIKMFGSTHPDSCGCGLYAFFFSTCCTFWLLTPVLKECSRICHGVGAIIAGDDHRIEVSLFYFSKGDHLTCPSRDPSQHSSLQAEIEAQSSALYSTARLWDDGIIKPTDTRDVVGLGLALISREKSPVSGKRTTTWDGDGKGYGVFRM